MRALLLAAGLGSRLRPLTERVPKCLVRIRGRPLLDYWLELMFEGGMERVLVNTHWLAEQVRAYIATSPWAGRVDLVHEPILLGTGGTVLANLDWLGTGDFLVAHADNLTDFDVPGLIEHHRRRPPGCELTMLAFRTDEPSSCGILEVDEAGIVRAFHEKVPAPPGNLANGAVYIFGQAAADRLRRFRRAEIDLSLDLIPSLVCRMLAVETRGYHRDIGTLSSLRRAHEELVRGPAYRHSVMAKMSSRSNCDSE